MGKIINILITLFFLSNGFTYAQDLKIIYELEYKAQLAKDSISKELMLLEINTNKKESVYKSLDKNRYHEILSEINSNGNNEKSKELITQLPQYSMYHEIFKNLIQNKFRVFESVMANVYSAEYRFSPQWTIINESKIVQGHQCKKGVLTFGGRRWIAWYAVDIPISDGPYKFYGLPGLILELASVDGDYKFKTTAIMKEDVDITFPKNTDLTYNNLNKLKVATVKDPTLQTRQLMSNTNESVSAVVLFDGKESKGDFSKSLNEEMKKWFEEHNNPIEKEDVWIK